MASQTVLFLIPVRNRSLKISSGARHQWRTPVILATQEAKIRRIEVQSQLGQMVCETLSQKNASQKRAGRVAQGIGPEFKPQSTKNKTNQKKSHLE
jgi:hypothetical protein